MNYSTVWAIVDRCRRYVPNVMEIVDKTQSLACVASGHSHFAVDLGGRRGDIDDHL